jgi:hypothetical protein
MAGIRTRAFAGVAALVAAASLGVTGPAWAGDGGANQEGPYTSVGTPSAPSENGQGKAPHLAGSKGNADDRNPPGQVKKFVESPDNGYECDGNNGIAKGNPAHSGCDDTGPQ